MRIAPGSHPRETGRPRGAVPTADPSAKGAAGRRALRISANLVGAASAAYFSYSFLHYFIQSHRLVGIVFFTYQTLVGLAYIVRRPARSVTRRLDDWLLAFGGTFAGVLFLPSGAHPSWGVHAGLVLQLIGVAVSGSSLLVLGRSFGFAAADRGLVVRGPYRLVRHPMYAAYFLLQTGYLLQSLSVRNAAVLLIGTLCNAGRALAEERHFAANTGSTNNTNPTTTNTNRTGYAAYRTRVRWRMLPGIW